MHAEKKNENNAFYLFLLSKRERTCFNKRFSILAPRGLYSLVLFSIFYIPESKLSSERPHARFHTGLANVWTTKIE